MSSRRSSEAATADKPWLASDGDAPTLDETRARIEWEAERAASARPHGPTSGDPPRTRRPGAPVSRRQRRPRPARWIAADPEAGRPAVELDRRDREARERLEAIRKELGVDAAQA